MLTFKRTNSTFSSQHFNWSLHYELSNGDEKKNKRKRNVFFFGAKITRGAPISYPGSSVLPSVNSRCISGSGKIVVFSELIICVLLENSFFSYFFILNQNRIKQQCPLRWCFPRFGVVCLFDHVKCNYLSHVSAKCSSVGLHLLLQIFCTVISLSTVDKGG